MEVIAKTEPQTPRKADTDDAAGPPAGGGGQGGKNFPGGNRRGGNMGGGGGGGGGGRGGRGGPNRFQGRGGPGGGGGGGNNQNFRGNRNQNQQQQQQEINTDNPGDVTMGGDQPIFPPQQQQQQQQQQQHHQNQQHQRSHNKGNNQRHQRNGGGGEEFLIAQKLSHLQGPTHEVPSIKYEEIKFSGRNRLYVGNLTSDATEEELKDLFKQYGEVSEIFLNAEKFFAFVKVDFRSNAEKAKRDLDGFMRSGRALRVRFAPNATTVRVKNLTQHVSNELLHQSFEIFGHVERAVIVVDDRGKPTGEGIVEFSRKSGAVAAIRYCTEKCFFLTSSLRPCVCDLFEHSDDTDGFPEKALNKKTQDFYSARQMGPRFAEFNSFEHEYGTRWKQLHELYKKKHDALTNEMRMEEEKLEAQMEYARYEHETELLRNQLRMREADRDQVKSNWEMKEKFADEQRIKSEEEMRRTQEEMALRMGKQEEELRRRQQENTLFMQNQHINQQQQQQQQQQQLQQQQQQQMIEPQNMNVGLPPNMIGMNDLGGGVDMGLVGQLGVGNMDVGMIGGNGGNIGNIGGGGGPMGMNPNQNQNQNQRKNFNNGNQRNFQQNNQMGGIQDDGGNFNNNNFGGGGGPNNNRGNNQGGGGGRGGGGRQWNNNHNNQQQQQQQQNNDGGIGGNNNFQNKRRRF